MIRKSLPALDAGGYRFSSDKREAFAGDHAQQKDRRDDDSKKVIPSSSAFAQTSNRDRHFVSVLQATSDDRVTSYKFVVTPLHPTAAANSQQYAAAFGVMIGQSSVIRNCSARDLDNESIKYGVALRADEALLRFH